MRPGLSEKFKRQLTAELVRGCMYKLEKIKGQGLIYSTLSQSHLMSMIGFTFMHNSVLSDSLNRPEK